LRPYVTRGARGAKQTAERTSFLKKRSKKLLHRRARWLTAERLREKCLFASFSSEKEGLTSS
jgi:hypothetical protein